MFKRINWLMTLSFMANLLMATAVFAQVADPMTFELSRAKFRATWNGFANNIIEVSLAKDFPTGASLAAISNTSNWRVRTVATKETSVALPSGNIVEPAGTIAHYTPVQAEAFPVGELVVLTLDHHLDQANHNVYVILMLPNFPEVTVGGSIKTGANKIFTSAKGKEDTDIYFSGLAAAARGQSLLCRPENMVDTGVTLVIQPPISQLWLRCEAGRYV